MPVRARSSRISAWRSRRSRRPRCGRSCGAWRQTWRHSDARRSDQKKKGLEMILQALNFVAGSTPSAQLLFQSELLHTPVHHLGDVQSVGIAAVNGIDHPELLELLAGLAEAPNHCAIQLHLVDLAVEERILSRVGVGGVEKMVRTRRDGDREGSGDGLEVGLVGDGCVRRL